MNYEEIEAGKHLLRYYYNAEAIAEMRREFRLLKLSEEEFPAYVAYCYDIENAPVNPHCW